jgi:hypothetical protein
VYNLFSPHLYFTFRLLRERGVSVTQAFRQAEDHAGYVARDKPLHLVWELIKNNEQITLRSLWKETSRKTESV